MAHWAKLREITAALDVAVAAGPFAFPRIRDRVRHGLDDELLTLAVPFRIERCAE